MPDTSKQRATSSVDGFVSPEQRYPRGSLLMWSMLRSFIWLDRCLQANVEARGWPALSRPESQIMLLASAGITRQVEISKALGLSRQAINQTMKQLKARGLIDILPDPEDGRCKVVAFAEEGAGMRADALEVMELMEQELVDRIGVKTVNAMYEALERNWGEIPVFEKD